MVVEAMLSDEALNEQLPQPVAVREKTTARMRLSSRRQKTHSSRLAGQSIARKYQRRAAIRHAEYRRLKAIVPSVADKKSVTKVLCSLSVFSFLFFRLPKPVKLRRVKTSDYGKGDMSVVICVLWYTQMTSNRLG